MTQKDWTLKQLNEYGEVTRNQALAHRITRLGAIIHLLKNEGYEIEGKQSGNNYIYKLITAPKPKVQQYKTMWIDGELKAVAI